MSENVKNGLAENLANESVKELANALKKVNVCSGGINLSETEESISSGTSSAFKVAGSNLPAKTNLWTKMKSVLFYELKVELTPKQQKIEDEINEFLYQEITWEKVRNFLFQEITFKKAKKV